MDVQNEPRWGDAQPSSDQTPLIIDFHSTQPERTHMQRPASGKRDQRVRGTGQAYTG